MKPLIYIVIIICILVLLGFFCLKPVILFLAQAQLEKVFIDSVVEIDDCDIKPFHKLELLNIKVKKEPVYDFRVGRLTIQFTPFSILKKVILKASLSDAAITINQPGKSIREFGQQLNYGGSRGVFALDSIELSDIKLNLDSKEAKLKAALSLVFDLKDQSLNSCDLKVESLTSAGFQLKNASLSTRRAGPAGTCFIDQVTHSDVTLRQVKGRARLEDEFLILDSLSAQLLGGELRGNARVVLDRDMRYTASLQFIKLDLDTIVRDFKLQEKVQLQGELAGSFVLEGSGAVVDVVSADLSAGKDGGTLTIKDNKYLDNLARRSNQSFDLIVDSFKDYRYNAGIVKLSLEGTDLIFDIGLEGEAGKRDLTVVLHDFKLTKEE
ncbi:YdbH domain-containing protein [Candidatus Omnitrophota bacterium]